MSQAHATIFFLANLVTKIAQLLDFMMGRLPNLQNLIMKLAYGMQGCVYVFNSFAEQFVGGGAGKVITMLVEAIG